MTPAQKVQLDDICAEACERLNAMKDRMESLGLYMGPRREPYQSRQAPMSFGGSPQDAPRRPQGSPGVKVLAKA
jgi:hypothetical protein